MKHLFVTQQLGEKQIGPIWWISVALIKGILPFHRRNENLVASLLIWFFSLQKTGFSESFCWFVHLQRHWVFVDSSTTTVWTLSYTVASSHCTCKVFVIQQLNQYLDNKWLPFKINHLGLCLNLNGIQFGHFLGLSMLSSHLLSSSLCRGTELTPDFALENLRWKSSGGLIWGTVKSVNND